MSASEIFEHIRKGSAFLLYAETFFLKMLKINTVKTVTNMGDLDVFWK